MSQFNINDMFQAAQGAADTSFGDLLGADDMPDGLEVDCEIVYSKAGTTSKGAPSWTNKLQITEGDLAGGEFFDSVYLSANQTDGGLSYNKRMFAKIQAAGLSAQFFASQPSAESIATALKGQKVRVRIKWQKQSAEDIAAGKRPFGEHTWTPIEATVAGLSGFTKPSGV